MGLEEGVMTVSDEMVQDNSGFVVAPEVINGTTYINLSGQPKEVVHNYFPKNLAESIIALPDLCPGKSPLPTGCCVEIDPIKHLEWREYTVSDVGCGMQVLESELTWDDFNKNEALWDKLLKRMQSQEGEFGDLGSGNHFIDAAMDDNGKVFFVIHTGSRNESPKVNDLVRKPDQFDKVYKETVDWARKNRDTIASIIGEVYENSNPKFVLDNVHNFYKQWDGKVFIYKGAVELNRNEMTIVPSSMVGDMAIVRGTANMSLIHNAMSHGTGRIESRSQSRTRLQETPPKSPRRDIYIPEGIADRDFLTEDPSCYRPLDACLELVNKFVTVEKTLTPIAYMGQFKKSTRMK